MECCRALLRSVEFSWEAAKESPQKGSNFSKAGANAVPKPPDSDPGQTGTEKGTLLRLEGLFGPTLVRWMKDLTFAVVSCSADNIWRASNAGAPRIRRTLPRGKCILFLIRGNRYVDRAWPPVPVVFSGN